MELAQLIQRITGYDGSIRRDLSKPDGTPRKLLDVSRLEGLGWKAAVSLEEGIRTVYAAYKKDAAAV
jgi:GDP-L-fucose synthase